MNKQQKRILHNVIALAVIFCGLLWVCSKFLHLGRVEYTDNAQIRRNIIPINSRVQGFIQKVCFSDFQFVHKGDTLVIIEDAEYRLKVEQAKANYQKALMENTAMETAISTTANIYADMIQTSDAAAADALDAVFSRIKNDTQQSG